MTVLSQALAVSMMVLVVEHGKAGMKMELRGSNWGWEEELVRESRDCIVEDW